MSYIEEAAGAFIWVTAAPLGGTLVNSLQASFGRCVKWIATRKIFDTLSRTLRFLVLWRFDSCPEVLELVREEEGASSGIARAVEKACETPEHSLAAFLTALLLLVGFIHTFLWTAIWIVLSSLRAVVGCQSEEETCHSLANNHKNESLEKLRKATKSNDNTKKVSKRNLRKKVQ